MKKYGNWTKFNELSKKDKIFRIVNLVFAFSMLVTTIGLLIYYLLNGDKNHRLMTCIMMSIVYILPFVFELIFRRRIKNLVTFCYLLYSLLAGLIGSVLYVYNLVSWYDIFIHTLMGYTFALLFLFLFSRLEKKNYYKFKPITIILVCVLFSLGCELVWELFEWASDNLLAQTAQGNPIVGYGAPLVTDTDLDLLCNFSGAILFGIQFVIGKYTKFNFGTKFIEKELLPDDIEVVCQEQQNKQCPKEEDDKQDIHKE